ncbi:AIF_collapsed_G0022760.mRNA.1.CDS.1 [Saccharomyces cerevisiae]|nr:BLD_1a_G0016460.mRNA.1.CDS.1 [Saccharomyces cerevisiae]CAI6700472.1 AIF_collapsed_G0022760.mRNA.1.CDS.1 [Saccharomyces cerevisiae]CAI7106201.1 BLD_1a_G0016460.mRNA.1.CDS.1 [Saccharomyces cerevisiae]
MNNANRAAHVITGSHSWGPHDSCAKFDKRMEFHVNAAKGDAVFVFGQPLPCCKCEPYCGHIDYKKSPGYLANLACFVNDIEKSVLR